jgi:hypothetical protein
MKHAVEMASGAIIYIPSFTKICRGFQELLRGDTHRHKDDLMYPVAC